MFPKQCSVCKFQEALVLLFHHACSHVYGFRSHAASTATAVWQKGSLLNHWYKTACRISHIQPTWIRVISVPLGALNSQHESNSHQMAGFLADSSSHVGLGWGSLGYQRSCSPAHYTQNANKAASIEQHGLLSPTCFWTLKLDVNKLRCGVKCGASNWWSSPAAHIRSTRIALRIENSTVG